MLDEDLRRYQQSPREFREAVWKGLVALLKSPKRRPRKRRPSYSNAPRESLRRMGRYVPPSRFESVLRSFIKLGESAWELLPAWANQLLAWVYRDLLSFLGKIGNASVILAVIIFIGTEKQRRDAEVWNAWQTLTSAHEQSGSGDRRRALEFLNASPGANWRRKFPWVCVPDVLCTWPRESLDGINLSADNGPQIEQGEETDEEQSRGISGRVYLRGIQLPSARLRHANLQRADLWGANLQWAFLAGANLQWANLRETHLQRATLRSANLKGTVLSYANLQRADLWGANLQGAKLQGAKLQGALLVEASLQGAEGLTQDQLSQAKLCFTALPDGFTLDPNRDCVELGYDPETGEYVGT